MSLKLLTDPLRWPPWCVGAPGNQGDTARRDRRGTLVRQVIERVHHRRRASDRADERANRAAKVGDLVGLWVASGQAEAARRRRAEWLERVARERAESKPTGDA